VSLRSKRGGGSDLEDEEEEKEEEEEEKKNGSDLEKTDLPCQSHRRCPRLRRESGSEVVWRLWRRKGGMERR